MKEKVTITTTKGFFSTFHVCTVQLMGGGFVSRQSEDLESLKRWSESLVGKSEKK